MTEITAKKKTVVVKYGGAAMKDESLKKAVIGNVARLSDEGTEIILVHGGGPEISSLSSRLGIKTEFVDGLRVTDKDTLDVVLMVLAGKVNKELSGMICSLGKKGVGISGVDGNTLIAKKKDERLGFVGDVVSSDPSLIRLLTENGYIPVVSTVARGEDGHIYNVNGDTAAAYIAGAVGADALILMTDAPGVLLDRDDPETLIPELSANEAREMIRTGAASGGMIPKLLCCVTAVGLGVPRVSVIDGKDPEALISAVRTGKAGTRVFRDDDNDNNRDR